MGLLIDQARAIASGERPSAEVVEEAVRAAERLQPELNTFTQIYADEAISLAREADDRGREGGPLHGVPVAVKDLFDVAGRVTSGCSRPFLGAPPASDDAPEVSALRNAGAIVIGKTNMHELAFGATTSASSYGRANNPWDAERLPGGSSGGSAAAVAARIVGLALGSDTGGSIRIPSSFCGATGLKTTWGLLPLAGVMPMAPSFDSAGPIASDAADAALAFDVLTGERGRGAPEVGGLRVGFARGIFFDAVTSEVAAAIDELAAWLEKAGARVSDVVLPWAEAAHRAWLPIALAEFGREYRSLQDRTDELDPTIAATLRAGIALPADDERQARETVADARRAFIATMRDTDVLLLPATAFTAPRHDEEVQTVAGVDLPIHMGGPSRYTRPFSVLPAAALALPAGAGAGGLPIGAQLVGGPRSERLLLAIGEAFQRDTDWHLRVPPVHA